MTEVASFAVQTAPRRYEIRQRPLPAGVDGGAVLRVEACGICGSEVELLLGQLFGDRLPIAPGHEVVGRIDVIAEPARRHWGVDVGDRVVLMSALRCGRCRGCVDGDRCQELAEGEAGSYGWRHPDVEPGLWGGFATHMWLAPGSIVVPMAAEVPLAAAVLFNPLANGIEWAVRLGRVGALDRVVVLGCGPQGLSCGFAAREAGASEIVVTGVAGDDLRLAMAERLGVTAAVDVTDAPGVDVIRDHLSADPDLVIDTTAVPDVVTDAVSLVRPGGTVVVSGFKRGEVRLAESISHAIVANGVAVRGARSKSLESLRRAVRMIELDPQRLAAMSTDSFPLADAQLAVEVFGGLHDGMRRPHVRVEPALTERSDTVSDSNARVSS